MIGGAVFVGGREASIGSGGGARGVTSAVLVSATLLI